MRKQEVEDLGDVGAEVDTVGEVMVVMVGFQEAADL